MSVADAKLNISGLPLKYLNCGNNAALKDVNQELASAKTATKTWRANQPISKDYQARNLRLEPQEKVTVSGGGLEAAFYLLRLRRNKGAI